MRMPHGDSATGVNGETMERASLSLAREPSFNMAAAGSVAALMQARVTMSGSDRSHEPSRNSRMSSFGRDGEDIYPSSRGGSVLESPLGRQVLPSCRDGFARSKP